MKIKRILLAGLASLGLIGLVWATQQGPAPGAWLAQHHQQLTGLVDRHYVIALAGYIALYALVTALSVPGASLLTLSGGWLFGIVPGTFATVTGATLGAVLVFLSMRRFLIRAGQPPALLQKPLARKIIDEFVAHGFSWLLVLRLVPVFPFWLVNLVPACTEMPLRTYIWATFIGIIPGSLVYVAAGHGLGSALANPGQITGALLWQPEIILPLLGLAGLALLPVGYHYLRRKGPHHANTL